MPAIYRRLSRRVVVYDARSAAGGGTGRAVVLRATTTADPLLISDEATLRGSGGEGSAVREAVLEAHAHERPFVEQVRAWIRAGVALRAYVLGEGGLLGIWNEDTLPRLLDTPAAALEFDGPRLRLFVRRREAEVYRHEDLFLNEALLSGTATLAAGWSSTAGGTYTYTAGADAAPLGGQQTLYAPANTVKRVWRDVPMPVPLSLARGWPVRFVVEVAAGTESDLQPVQTYKIGPGGLPLLAVDGEDSGPRIGVAALDFAGNVLSAVFEPVVDPGVQSVSLTLPPGTWTARAFAEIAAPIAAPSTVFGFRAARLVLSNDPASDGFAGQTGLVEQYTGALRQLNVSAPASAVNTTYTTAGGTVLDVTQITAPEGAIEVVESTVGGVPGTRYIIHTDN